MDTLGQGMRTRVLASGHTRSIVTCCATCATLPPQWFIRCGRMPSPPYKSRDKRAWCRLSPWLGASFTAAATPTHSPTNTHPPRHTPRTHTPTGDPPNQPASERQHRGHTRVTVGAGTSVHDAACLFYAAFSSRATSASYHPFPVQSAP